MVGYEGAGRASQRATLLGSYLQAILGIGNNVRFWCLLIGWIPRWDSLWMSFPSVSAPFFFKSCVSFRMKIFWIKSFEMFE